MLDGRVGLIDCAQAPGGRGCAHEEASARDGGARRPGHHRAGAGVVRARGIAARRRGGPAVRGPDRRLQRRRAHSTRRPSTAPGATSRSSYAAPAVSRPRPGRRSPTGPGPGYGVAADFNGDGLPDVATQNFNDGTVSVLLRQPGGGFAAGPTLSVGAGTGSVTAADFNGDGRVDIAAPSYTAPPSSPTCNTGTGFTQEGTQPHRRHARATSWPPTSTATGARTWPSPTSAPAR